MSAGLATGDGPAGLSAQEEKVDILASARAPSKLWGLEAFFFSGLKLL